MDAPAAMWKEAAGNELSADRVGRLLADAAEEGGKSPIAPASNDWTTARVAIVVSLFLLAGLLEIGGGWFVWIFVRGRPNWENGGHAWWVGLVGAAMLLMYGVVPTLQPMDDFGRVYAAYGGIFIALSFLWAYAFDGYVPDTGDAVGTGIASVGVAVILFWPR